MREEREGVDLLVRQAFETGPALESRPWACLEMREDGLVFETLFIFLFPPEVIFLLYRSRITY